MYRVPQPHKCPACGYECQYGQDDPHPGPVLNDGPTCPRCWANFVRSVAPAMENLSFPSPPRPPFPVST